MTISRHAIEPALERFLSNDGRRCGPRRANLACSDFTRASFAIRSSRSYSAFGDVPMIRRISFTASENADVAAWYSAKSRVFSSQLIPALGLLPYTTARRGEPELHCGFCKQILTEHHGKIRFRSSQRLGRSGTVFLVMLPFRPN